MDDAATLTRVSHEIAAAIAARDISALSAQLAEGFVHHTPGGETIQVDAFLRGIEQIPGEIVSVTIDLLQIDVAGDAALVSGIQHAQVRLEGETIDDVRAFADFFVRVEGQWRLRAAVDLPGGGCHAN